MPRTAITLTKGHDGKWSLVSHPDVPLMEQLKASRDIRAKLSDAKTAEHWYWESDGQPIVHRMRTPDAQKKHDEQRAKENQAAIAVGKDLERQKLESETNAQKIRDDAHKADLKRLEDLQKPLMETSPKPKETKSTVKT